MKLKIASTFALVGLAMSAGTFAQTAAPAAAPAAAPTPDYTLTYNVGAVTEYRYRGISQTGKKPALQGGADLGLKSGVYLGTWLSTISWIKDSTSAPNTTKGPVEVDLYGGYKNSINDTFSFDVGGLQYWYASNNLGNTAGFANANTFELYGALSAGPATLKYSRSTGNLFGVPNSKGSGYLDLSASFDLGSGWSVAPHVGVQTVKNYSTFSYTDYSLAVNKDFDGLVLSATFITTNFKSKNGAAYNLPGTGTKDLAGSTLVIGLKKNF